MATENNEKKKRKRQQSQAAYWPEPPEGPSIEDYYATREQIRGAIDLGRNNVPVKPLTESDEQRFTPETDDLKPFTP